MFLLELQIADMTWEARGKWKKIARMVVLEEYPELRPTLEIYKKGMSEAEKLKAKSNFLKTAAEELLKQGRFTRIVDSEVLFVI